MKAESIQALQQLLNIPQKCVIVTHRNPDGDALGSSLAWKSFLEKKGHLVDFISPTFFTASLKWMKGTASILVFEDYKTKASTIEKIQQATVIFCLDFNALSRLEDLGVHIQKATAVKVMIDHHQQPEDFASIVFSSTAHGATAEMIYDIIEDLQETDLIDAEIARLKNVPRQTTGIYDIHWAEPTSPLYAILKRRRPDVIVGAAEGNPDRPLGLYHRTDFIENIPVYVRDGYIEHEK